MLAVQGKFGPIEVRPYRGSKMLCINGQVQGGAAEFPSAAVVQEGLKGPGPVSTSCYTLGWLACGVHNPTAKGLMIGLGSGAGAVSLLHEFPRIKLDVIEIDPALVEVAKQEFPLLRHYIDQGDINVIVADAGPWLTERALGSARPSYVFCLHDAYDGGKCMSLGGQDFYTAVKSVAEYVWVNIIGKPHTGHMLEEMHAMAGAGMVPETLFCADHSLGQPFADMVDMRKNWIVSSQETIPELMDSFTPYEGIDPAYTDDPQEAAIAFSNVDRVRSMWDAVVASEMDREEIHELIACLTVSEPVLTWLSMEG